MNDPSGNQLEYDSTDPLVHFAGDPALHTAGEVQHYVGGEPIVDELGRPVINADGSYFTARAGQAVIHNRRDLAFAPDYLSFDYDPNDLTLDLYGNTTSALSSRIDEDDTSLAVAAPTGGARFAHLDTDRTTFSHIVPMVYVWRPRNSKSPTK